MQCIYCSLDYDNLITTAHAVGSNDLHWANESADALNSSIYDCRWYLISIICRQYWSFPVFKCNKIAYSLKAVLIEVND